MNRLFNFNASNEAARVLKTVEPQQKFTDVELEKCLLVFSRTMHTMAGSMKNIGGVFAVLGGLALGAAAYEGRPLPALVSGIAGAASGIFARRKSQQQEFYYTLTTVVADRQITGARKHLRELAAGA